MSKIVPLLEEITDRVKLFDLAGEFIHWIEPEKAREYIRRGEAIPLHTKRKIRGVKLIADYSDCGGPIEIGGGTRLGEPHRRETYSNPKGVLTFDRIPKSSRKIFKAVVLDCLKAA